LLANVVYQLPLGMALTKFVRNVDDLSDDGGYKFRFNCDRCNDGVESQYISSSANLLKTGLEVFQMFRLFGSSSAVDGIDRGLRGKERDSAYEKAVNEATAHFHKCSHCGNWTCGHCWNEIAGLCEGCAPDADEAAAKAAADNRVQHRLSEVASSQATAVAMVTCPVCGKESGGGKFCMSCGGATTAKVACKKCNAPLLATARFCGECGTSA